MSHFSDTTNHTTALKEIKLPNNESKRIRLVDVKARVASDISLHTSNNSVTANIKSSPFDGPKGIWNISLKGKSIGTVTLEAKHKDKVVATVKIIVFSKVIISLPEPSTVPGMLTRLFLAESINPGHVNYKEDESKKSMLWMRLVIRNRLNHKTPNIFGARKKPGKEKYDIYDIVQAKGQFHGFEKYPNIDADIKNNLIGFLSIANNYNHPAREKYAYYIENAKAVAADNALIGVTDPSKKGLFGWRTKGSSAPGGSFTKYQDLAGQTFYTLK